MRSPSAKDRTMEITDNSRMIFTPETSQSKYCPDVMTAQSMR